MRDIGRRTARPKPSAEFTSADLQQRLEALATEQARRPGFNEMTLAGQVEELLRVARRPLAANDIAKVLYRVRPGAPPSLMRRIRDMVNLLSQAGRLELAGKERRIAVDGVSHPTPVYRLKT